MKKILIFIMFIIATTLVGCDENPEQTKMQEEIYKLAQEVGYEDSFNKWKKSIPLEAVRVSKNTMISVSGEYVIWKNENDKDWYILAPLVDIIKGKADISKDILVVAKKGVLEWKYKEDEEWNELISNPKITTSFFDIVKVGYVNKVDFNFALGLNSDNNEEQNDLLFLLYGYATMVKYDYYIWDTVSVLYKHPVESIDSMGNTTFTFEIKKDLKYSDGSPITAKDYLLYIMLLSSKEWKDAFSVNLDHASKLLGYDEYISKDSLDQKFNGVRLLGDYKFSVTLKGSDKEGFYNSKYLGYLPLRLESYLPGYDIKDDGAGAYITKVDNEKSIKDTIIESVAKEKVNPTATCGPFRIVSQDDDLILKINHNYNGSVYGLVPKIDMIIISNDVSNESLLTDNKIDLLLGVSSNSTIYKLKDNENLEYYSISDKYHFYSDKLYGLYFDRDPRWTHSIYWIGINYN